LIGHNDLYGEVVGNQRPANQVVAEVKEIVRNTIRQLRAGNPQIDIFLAEIPPSAYVTGSTIPNLNAAYRALASETNTAVSPVRTVDMYTGFNIATDHYDGVHPNQAGDDKISQRWLDAIRPVMQSSGSCS
jgi:lysophospholipase L1-like esterase